VIVLGVLGILHAFAFQGRISNGDPPTYWLPTWCFLGHALRAGHVPLWNPYTLAGTPFAADPQSGWMYLPPMLLFSVLSCGAAIRWMLLLQPILAGLGLLWFLRSEGLSRPGASTGGIVLAFVVAGSEVVLSLPFAAMLAWTSVSLALLARLLRAGTWPRRLGWTTLTAASWGQLAAAHFSVGLLVGTLTLAFYVVTRVGLDVGRRVSSIARAAATLGALLASAAVVNLGFLLPRLAYVSRTNLGAGYASLERTTERLTGQTVLRLAHPPSAPTWPLKLATTPGAHVAAVALGLAFAAFWSRRHRALAATFGLLGGLCYAATLRVVAERVPQHLRSFRLFDFYLHSPEWFGYPLLLVVAVLAAIGVEAWREPRPRSERLLMLLPGALAWGLFPPLFGAGFRALAILLAGALAGVVALWTAAHAPRMAWVLTAVVVVEMAGAGLFVGTYRVPFRPGPSLLTELPSPSIDVARYLQPTHVDRKLQMRTDRFIANDLPGWTRHDAVPTSSVFRTRSAQGYSPTALARYWYFVRAVAHRPLDYNLSLIVGEPPVAIDLLGVEDIVSRRPPPASVRAEAVTGGRVRVYEIEVGRPWMATFFQTWRTVPSADAALLGVSARGFDPSRTLIVERTPPPHGAAAPPARSYAALRWSGDQTALVHVEAPSSGMTLVRIPYDPGWHATVDGRAVAVVPADYVDLAVPVAQGRHDIELTYRDPWVWYGLAGSVAGLLALGLAALLATVAGRRDHRRRGESPG